MNTAIHILLYAVAIYLALGGLFAIAFHAVALPRLDPATHDAGWFFRSLITPGVVALWPLLAARWMRTTRGGNSAGEAEQPISARRQRALHGLGIKLIAVLIPLVVGAALWWRPAPQTQDQSSKLRKVEATGH